MALSQLLQTQVPAELVDLSPALQSRMAYVDLVAAWSDVGKRAGVLQHFFPRMLNHMPDLHAWVAAATGPFQKAMLLMKVLGVDVPVGSLDEGAFRVLDRALFRLRDVRLDSRSADENIEYLQETLQKRNTPNAAGKGELVVSVSSLASEGHEARLSTLSADLLEWSSQEEPDPRDAIDMIYSSKVNKAILWLHGEKVAASLPAVFSGVAAMLPGKMDEYTIDYIKTDDTGKLDPELEELTVTHLYVSGKTLQERRFFFRMLHSLQLGAIDWEKHLISKLIQLMDPSSKATFTLKQALDDPDRWSSHLTYVPRALMAVHKLSDVDNSFSALASEIGKVFTQAKRGGDALREDCLDQMALLYPAIWTNAEQYGVASLKTAIYQSQLVDVSGFTELVIFRSFAEQLPQMKAWCTRFKRTFSNSTGGTSLGGAGGSGDAGAVSDGKKRSVVKDDIKDLVGRSVSSIHEHETRKGFFGHTVNSDWWYHEANIQELLLPTTKCKICVLVTFAPFSKGLEGFKLAVGFCKAGHALNAPEHSWFQRQTELKEQLVLDTHCFKEAGRRAKLGLTPSRRTPDGGRGGKGGGKGKGRFQRQTAKGK